LVSHYSSYRAVFFILGSMHLIAALILWWISADPVNNTSQSESFAEVKTEA
jgi:hypothetical protein